MTRPDESTGVAWISKLASIAIVVAALYAAKGLLVPFTLAVLLSFLLAPLCDAVERLRVGRVPAVLLTAVLAFSILGVIGWTVAAQLTDLARQLPEYQVNITDRLHSINDYVGHTVRRIAKTSEEIGRMSTADVTGGLDSEERAYPVRVVAPPTAALQVVTSMFGTLVEILGTAGIVIIFVIFFLLRREDLRDRFIRLVGHAQVTVTTQALDDAAERVSKYLAMQLLINALFGFAVAVGLFVIGIPNAILWGLLGTALRFIPYIGPWIAALIPILLSLAISTGWTKPIATVGMFITLELIVNNVLEPLFYGSRTGVSPVAVLAAAVFWTWLWGGAGLLLATPLTVCLVVLGKYVPQLVFLDIVLGDQPVFDEKTRVYQRLLAGDAEEATELVADRFQTSSLVDVYDSLLLPALAIAEKERHRGELDEYGHRFVYQSLRALTDELAVWEQQRINQLSEKADAGAGVQSERIVPKGAKLCVLCLPARDEADEIAGIMLARLLEFSGICADTASVTSLASEMIEGVAERNSDLVCVSAMPPAAVTHARYLCKRLNARYPEVPLVVGLWNARGDMIKARERIGCGSTVRIATSLSGALEEIRALAQPLLVSLSSPGQKNAPESLAATRSP